VSNRITRDEKLMRMASIVALRGTCLRLSVGAIIARDNRSISEGYVGSLPGMPHCLEWGCEIEDDHCTRTNHAEMNALLFAARNGIATSGSEIYVTHTPCLTCTKAIITAGVQRVVWGEEYGDVAATTRLLQKAGIRFDAYKLGE